MAPIPTEAVRVLSRFVREFDARARVPHDAVYYARTYRSPEDREFVGLLSALFAFGRVKSFLAFLEALLSRFGERPADELRVLPPRGLRGRVAGLRYRWVGEEDLLRFLLGIRGCLRRDGSLQRAFERGAGSGRAADYRNELRSLHRALRVDGMGERSLHKPEGRSYRNLVSDPSRGSSCKRWNLYLRWMIRPDDGVDLGVWKGLSPSRLTIPLDTHVFRVSQHLGLTQGRDNRWETAEEITEQLRRVDPRDPVRLDFALCHFGMSGPCPSIVDWSNCARCPLRTICLTFRASRAEASSGTLRQAGHR